jgi:hypothetical protein
MAPANDPPRDMTLSEAGSLGARHRQAVLIVLKANLPRHVYAWLRKQAAAAGVHISELACDCIRLQYEREHARSSSNRPPKSKE